MHHQWRCLSVNEAIAAQSRSVAREHSHIMGPDIGLKLHYIFDSAMTAVR